MNYNFCTAALFLMLLIGSIPAADQISEEPFFDRLGSAPERQRSETSVTSVSNLDSTELDTYIERAMMTYNVPGVSAVIVKEGEIIWSGTYGMANIKFGIPVTDSTLFMLASVSKTVTGLALLQLWEAGEFDLDDDINDYQPFPIVNPNYPDRTITFRMLLTHTSSLNDNWDVMFSTYVQGDTPIPLVEYVEDYFTPGGVFYDSAMNFNSWAPGTRWDYCNHGFVLAGYLVEAITGIPFDQYCNDSIFAPLQMEKTSWFIAGLNTDNVAMPYHYNGTDYEPLGHFGYADYPAGTLRSSTVELANHLVAFAQFGRFDSVQILDSATVHEIITWQCPDIFSSQGLTWFNDYVGGRWVWRHGGGDQGVSTMLSYCPAEETGVIVLTNGESALATNNIVHELYEYAAQEPVVVQAWPSFGPAPLTVNFTDESAAAETWLWEFGDGDTSGTQNPSHVYSEPGFYDVTLTIDSPQGEVSKTFPGMVSVHNDTLRLEASEFYAGVASVPIYAHNFLPLKSIALAFSWEGPIPMIFDSVSTVGTRSNFVESATTLAFDSDSCRTAVLLDFTVEHATDRLEAGEGPVATLHFSDSGLVGSGSNPIVFTSFVGRLHEFTADAGQYQPTSENGSLSFSPFCCLPPTVGDPDRSGLVDITDLQILLDNLFLTLTPLLCEQEGNINYPGSGSAVTDSIVDITDVQLLVDHLFLSLSPMPACP